MKKNTLSPANVKEVLRVIYQDTPVSRMSIVDKTDLSKVTVARIVNRLIDEGLVYESEHDVSTGGRRPYLIELKPDARYIMAADIGLGEAKFGIYDLKLKPRAEKAKTFKVGLGGKSLCRLMVDSFKEIREELDIKEESILGIGASLPGVINPDKGVVVSSYITRDKNIDISQALSAAFKKEVFIDKDANAGLYLEKWQGIGVGINNIIYIYTRNYTGGNMGLGVAFYLNGQIYRGANYACGEMGLAEKEKGDGEIFEPFSSYEAMPSLERLVKMKKIKPDSSLKECIKNNNLNFTTIIEAAGEGDEAAREILSELGDKIGRGCGFLVNLVNPRLIIIGGDFAGAQESFYKALNESIKKYSFDFAVSNLNIQPAYFIGNNNHVSQAAFLVVGSMLGYK